MINKVKENSHLISFLLEIISNGKTEPLDKIYKLITTGNVVSYLEEKYDNYPSSNFISWSYRRLKYINDDLLEYYLNNTDNIHKLVIQDKIENGLQLLVSLLISLSLKEYKPENNEEDK